MLPPRSVYEFRLRAVRDSMRFRKPLLVFAGLACTWSIAVILIEIGCTITGVDLLHGNMSPWIDLLIVWLYYRMPQVIAFGVLAFHFYVIGAMAVAAGWQFLRPKGVVHDLLAVTPFGVHHAVFAQYFAVVRAFAPHFAVLALVNGALALQNTYGWRHASTYFPRELGTYPPLHLYFVVGVLVAVLGMGLLAHLAGLSVMAAVATPRLRVALVIVLRLLLFFGLVFFGALLSAFQNTITAGIFVGLLSLLDGGFTEASDVLAGQAYGFRGGVNLPKTGLVLLVQPVAAFLLTAAALRFSLWRLRRPR